MIFTKEQRREAEEMIEKCYEMLNKIYTMSNGGICVSVAAYSDEPCIFIHDNRKQKSKTHLICKQEEISGFFGRHKI